jgi:hypothetical protein
MEVEESSTIETRESRSELPLPSYSYISLGSEQLCTVDHVCHLRSHLMAAAPEKCPEDAFILGLFVFYASWNGPPAPIFIEQSLELVLRQQKSTPRHNNKLCYVTGFIKVDDCEESLCKFLGDNDHENNHPLFNSPPPEELPVLAMVLQDPSSMKHPEIRYLSGLRPSTLLKHWSHPTSTIPSSIRQEIFGTLLQEMEESIQSFYRGQTSSSETTTTTISPPALRIFVAGDRMSVGKSSMCLGLLGTLIAKGYDPDSLAYIKPATQNESPQLVQKYCESVGIACVPAGPVVYYRGFTRAFLAGDTESTEELLGKVEVVVDQIALGKRVVIVDGVGFPAVGSICGTDNAAVARASGYPPNNSNGRRGGGQRKPCGVLVVGGSGVGGAVDAFNLNATYFEHASVPVLGAIFNKLSLDGFYSLENCKAQITSYFDQNAHQQELGRRPFGFVPLYPGITGEDGMNQVAQFFKTFGEHVNVDGILQAARHVQQQQSEDNIVGSKNGRDDSTSIGRARNGGPPHAKRLKRTNELQTTNHPAPSRQEIEQQAIRAGAAPSA